MKYAWVMLIVVRTLSGTCRGSFSKGPEDCKLAASKMQMDFAIKLLRYSSQTCESSLLSPSAVISALMILHNGAGGETRREIEALFGADDQSVQASRDDYSCAIRFLIQNTLSYKNQNSEQSSILWFRRGLPILVDFRNLMARDHVELEETHFDDTEEFIWQVTDWLAFDAPSSHQRGFKSSIFLNFGLDMFLTGKMRFEANWKHPFKTFYRLINFTLPSSQTTYMSMIARVADFPYYEDQNVQVVSLPFENDEMQMLIILPRRMLGLPELETTLTTEKLSSYIDAVKVSERTFVVIPKFGMKKYFVLSDALEDMNVQSMFSESANFSLISNEPLSVTKRIVSYSTIEVNEKGVGKRFPQCLPDDGGSYVRTFYANHPFLFVIFDNEKNIQWIGRYNGEEPTFGAIAKITEESCFDLPYWPLFGYGLLLQARRALRYVLGSA